MEGSIPLNRVHALDLQRALAAEFEKREWREAMQRATTRWLAEGHVIERVANQRRTRVSGWYIEE